MSRLPSGMWTLPDVDPAPVDNVMLGTDGLLNIVPSSTLHQFPLEVLQIWCVKRGIYQIPTSELVEWLATKIAGRRAIEIGAGNGALGRALGIPVTDSWMQTRPEIAAYYTALGQHPITPPPDVEKLDAAHAIRRYQPEIVIGSWVTQRWQSGDPDGSVDGVHETALLECADYIHIGNDRPHRHKRINNLPHELHRFTWLISRGQDETLNHIRTWTRIPRTT